MTFVERNESLVRDWINKKQGAVKHSTKNIHDDTVRSAPFYYVRISGMAERSGGDPEGQEAKPYIIFFDVNMPKRHLRRDLEYIKDRASIHFFNGINCFDEKGKAPCRMSDSELLTHTVQILNRYYPNHPKERCFFFTLDKTFRRAAGPNHPGHNRVIIEIFTTRKKHELLAEAIIKRFELHVAGAS